MHLNQYILHQGRCSYYVSPSLTPEQVEALNAENAEKDPEVEQLKAIVEDKPLASHGFESNWQLRQCGETLNFAKGDGTACYSVVLLRNLTWPGAAAVAWSGGWVNVYVGYGQKISQPSFLPISPGPLL